MTDARSRLRFLTHSALVAAFLTGALGAGEASGEASSDPFHDELVRRFLRMDPVSAELDGTLMVAHTTPSFGVRFQVIARGISKEFELPLGFHSVRQLEFNGPDRVWVTSPVGRVFGVASLVDLNSELDLRGHTCSVYPGFFISPGGEHIAYLFPARYFAHPVFVDSTMIYPEIMTGIDTEELASDMEGPSLRRVDEQLGLPVDTEGETLPLFVEELRWINSNQLVFAALQDSVNVPERDGLINPYTFSTAVLVDVSNDNELPSVVTAPLEVHSTSEFLDAVQDSTSGEEPLTEAQFHEITALFSPKSNQ